MDAILRQELAAVDDAVLYIGSVLSDEPFLGLTRNTARIEALRERLRPIEDKLPYMQRRISPYVFMRAIQFFLTLRPGDFEGMTFAPDSDGFAISWARKRIFTYLIDAALPEDMDDDTGDKEEVEGEEEAGTGFPLGSVAACGRFIPGNEHMEPVQHYDSIVAFANAIRQYLDARK